MLNQFFRSLILLMGSNVYPRAVERIADDLLALSDEFLNEVGGVEEGVFRNLSKSSLFYEVDAGIGIIVILRLFDKSFDVATI